MEVIDKKLKKRISRDKRISRKIIWRLSWRLHQNFPHEVLSVKMLIHIDAKSNDSFWKASMVIISNTTKGDWSWRHRYNERTKTVQHTTEIQQFQKNETDTKDWAYNICNNHLVCENSESVKNYCNILHFVKFILVSFSCALLF